MVTQMSLGQPQDMPLLLVEEPCHGALRSKTEQQCQLWRQIVSLVTIELKSIALRYI